MQSDSDNLIIEHLELPKNVAKILCTTVGWPFKGVVDFDDIVSAGNLGLIDAARKYDPEKAKHGFIPYAMIRIRGAVYDFLRQVSWAPKVLVKESKRTGKPLTTIRSITNYSGEGTEILLESESISGDAVKVLRLKNSQTRQAIEKIDNLDTINYLIQNFNLVDRTIVSLYYLEQKTYVQIGKEVGISESGICVRLKNIKIKAKHRIDDLLQLDAECLHRNLR